MKTYYVYIMTNRLKTTVYTGMTNDLRRRVREHKGHINDGFTSRYNLHHLVFYESTSDVHAAIAREKQIKGWSRAKKNALIDAFNPTWRDLSQDFEGDSSRSSP